MDEQPTCGKGLAENATLPWKISQLAGAMGLVLEAHLPALDLTDEHARKEHEVYQRLAGEFRQAAAEMEAITRQMSAARDLPMGRHDPAAMASAEVHHAFDRFVQMEQEMLAMLQGSIERDRQILAAMRK